MEIQIETIFDRSLRKKYFSSTLPVRCFVLVFFAFFVLVPKAGASSRQIRRQPVSKSKPLPRSVSRPMAHTSVLASPTVVSFSAAGKTVTLRVLTRATEEWAVINSNSWIAVTPANGRGNQRLQLSVQQNTECAARSGSISINGGIVNIRQASANKNYSLSASNAIFSARPASGSVALNADCSWTVQTDVNWISTIAPASDNGDGNATIVYSVEANSNPSPRTGFIKILDGNSMVRQRLSVTQQGAEPSNFQFAPASTVVSAEGGTERAIHRSGQF